MLTRMFQRRGTSARWATVNPIPGDGELCLIDDPGSPIRIKIGNGIDHFLDLPEFPGSAGSSQTAFSANALFGTGEDGDMSLPSGLTTFDRNYNFHDLYIPADAILDTGGYCIAVSGVMSGSGIITANGGDAVGPSGGDGYSGYGVSGRNGGNSGSDGSGNGCSVGGDGGAGSASAGGTGGSEDTGTPTRGGILIDVQSILVQYGSGGSGGGGGGSGDDGDAGAGGGGGGSIWLCAFTNAFTGTISANGGAGSAATGTNAGGGGGGGGGLIMFVAGAGVTLPEVTCSGGLGGAGNGAGAAGLPGADGHVGAYAYGSGSSTPVDVTINPPGPEITTFVHERVFSIPGDILVKEYEPHSPVREDASWQYASVAVVDPPVGGSATFYVNYRNAPGDSPTRLSTLIIPEGEFYVESTEDATDIAGSGFFTVECVEANGTTWAVLTTLYEVTS